MITVTIPSASEALRLPSAQLDEEQWKIVNKILGNIRDAIEVQGAMKHNGFEFGTNNTDPSVMFEVLCALELMEFKVQCTARLEQNRFQPNGPPTHTGYQLTCIPSLEAVKASRRTLQ